MFRLASTGARRRVGCRRGGRRGVDATIARVTRRTVLRRVVRPRHVARRRVRAVPSRRRRPSASRRHPRPPSVPPSAPSPRDGSRRVAEDLGRRGGEHSRDAESADSNPWDASFRIPEKYLGMSRAVNGIASPPARVPERELATILAAAHANLHGVVDVPRDDISARGVRPWPMFNHSCAPEAVVSFNPGASSACTPWKGYPWTRRFVSRTRNCTPPWFASLRSLPKKGRDAANADVGGRTPRADATRGGHDRPRDVTRLHRAITRATRHQTRTSTRRGGRGVRRGEWAAAADAAKDAGRRARAATLSGISPGVRARRDAVGERADSSGGGGGGARGRAWWVRARSGGGVVARRYTIERDENETSERRVRRVRVRGGGAGNLVRRRPRGDDRRAREGNDGAPIPRPRD